MLNYHFIYKYFINVTLTTLPSVQLNFIQAHFKNVTNSFPAFSYKTYYIFFSVELVFKLGQFKLFLKCLTYHISKSIIYLKKLLTHM